MRFLYFLFAIGIVQLCMAQHYPILHYTTQDGLSQMQVMSTFRDSRGYLWIGTKYGFCKFNGESFERFAPDFKTVGSEVREFVEDKKGYIYIASLSWYLSRFDGQKLVEIKKPQGEFQNLCVDDQNRVFCRNHTTGELNVVINDSLVVVKWPSLKNRKVKWLTYDKPTHTLIADIDSGGLMRITPQRLTPIAHLPLSRKPIHDEVWLRARNGKAIIHRRFLNDEGEYFAEFGKEGWQPFLQINNGTYKVLRTVPFDWFFNCPGQTYLLEANSRQVVSVFSEPFTSYQQNTYTAHGTWLGTEKGLVFVVQNGINYFPESQVPNAWSVVEDTQKRMWFLNYGHPVQRWDGQRVEKVTGYEKRMIQQQRAANVPKAAIGVNDDWYYGALRDKRGHLWLPNSMGVLWYDGKQFDFLVRPAPGYSTSITFSLLEDPERNVVLQGSEGVVHIFENQPPFRSTSLTQKEGLNTKSLIFSMVLERSGVYWFGAGKKLFRYDAIKKQWLEYSWSNKKLSAIGLVDLTFDHRNTLWLATFSKGLAYLDARRDTVRHVEAPEFREPVYSVMQIDNDHLLIGSLRNLYVMDLKAWYASKKVILKGFNHHNGFTGLEPGQNGLYRDSRGHIWVMSSTVLSVIDPKKLDLRPGQVHTYATKLNGQRLPFAQLAKDSVFTLPFGKGDVRIEFESVGDDKPFHSQYSYYVEGLTDGWTPWQEEPVATLTHLASGTYSIRVKSRTGGTEANNSHEACIRFSVSVWPWQSPYFPYYASIIIGLVIGALGWVYWQKDREQRQNKYEKEQAKWKAEKESMEAQKQIDEAEEKVRQQTQALQILEIQTVQAQMNPHFFSNALTTLQSLVYQNQTLTAIENIAKFGELMRSYMNASLSLDGTRESLEKGMITLEQEIELLQVYIDFEQLQYRGRFDASIKVSSEIDTGFFKILPLLIQPFVENAIKHGVLPNTDRKGSVSIDFWTEDDEETLVCRVEDNGVGRKASESFQKKSLQGHRSEGTNLIHKRAALLNQLGYTIRIHITDRPGGGTTVILKIKDHL